MVFNSTLGTSLNEFPQSLDMVSLHEWIYLVDPTRLWGFPQIPKWDWCSLWAFWLILLLWLGGSPACDWAPYKPHVSHPPSITESSFSIASRLPDHIHTICRCSENANCYVLAVFHIIYFHSHRFYFCSRSRNVQSTSILGSTMLITPQWCTQCTSGIYVFSFSFFFFFFLRGGMEHECQFERNLEVTSTDWAHERKSRHTVRYTSNLSCGILYMYILVASRVNLRPLCSRRGVCITHWMGNGASTCQRGVWWVERIECGCWKGWMIWIIDTMIVGIVKSRWYVVIWVLWLQRMQCWHRAVSVGWRVCRVVLWWNIWHLCIGSRLRCVPASIAMDIIMHVAVHMTYIRLLWIEQTYAGPWKLLQRSFR